MKRILSGAGALLLMIILPLSAEAARLVPVGKLIGLQLRTEAVTVAAFDDTLGIGAADAGVQIGDRLLEVNGKRIREAADVPKLLDGSSHAALTLLRGSKKLTVTVPVQETPDGGKLGIYLRQGISGIGTVTWYDPESGTFGALGHGVSGSDGIILPMMDGAAFDAELSAVRRGRSGEPGQLRGETSEALRRGTLFKNTPQGVFGKTEKGWEGELLETAEYDEILPGTAVIRCSVCGGEPRDYSVEILKIYPKDRPDGRNFLIRVTDPALLETTGGIIQGMGVSYNRDNTGTLKACKG